MKGKPTLEEGEPTKPPVEEEGEPTGVEKEPTGLARRDIVRRVPLTGVVPSGESHPDVGEEEKSWRPGERGEWERGERRERRACEGCWLLSEVAF